MNVLIRCVGIVEEFVNGLLYIVGRFGMIVIVLFVLIYIL